MIGLFLKIGRRRALAVIAGLVIMIAAADRAVGNQASLGVFYVLPMVLGAMVLPPPGMIGLAIVCSSLRAVFDIPSPYIEALLRFIFATFAYSFSAFFVAGVIRNRELEMEHLTSLKREQERRRDAEAQLNTLVESSPAAILTVDDGGTIIAANSATSRLFMLPEGETAQGRPVGGYLPVLEDALHFNPGPAGLRTAAQCQGRRDNGEIFLANTWFSSYATPRGMHLAAIAVDSSEEMRDREEQGLRQLTLVNRIATAAVFHEVRNLCGAISVISSNLRDKYASGPDEDFEAMASLVAGLEKVASVQLQARTSENLENVGLRSVLDDLRIIIEPDWREIGGTVAWNLPASLPSVLAERHGLLQVCLNIAQNSRRAVQERSSRELLVSASLDDDKVRIRFIDSGPGVAAPARLFAPFQPGADGTGLGLYVSRAVVRSYGGDLQFEPQSTGACFAVELQVVS